MIYIEQIEKESVLCLDRNGLAEYIVDMMNDEPCTVVVMGEHEDVTFIAEQSSIPGFLVVLNSGIDYMDIIDFDKDEILEELDKMENIKRVYRGIVKLKIELGDELEIDVD